VKRKRKFSKYKQGIYKPSDNQKYKGHSNPRYLSSWELKFFRWCDSNPSVIEWSSESVIIPYINPLDGKAHRYMVDNKIILREGAKITKYLIEIKPFKQTRKPTTHGNKKKSTMIYESVEYVRNQAKWNAAKKWCDKHGYKFQILTERELFR